MYNKNTFTHITSHNIYTAKSRSLKHKNDREILTMDGFEWLNTNPILVKSNGQMTIIELITTNPFAIDDINEISQIKLYLNYKHNTEWDNINLYNQSQSYLNLGDILKWTIKYSNPPLPINTNPINLGIYCVAFTTNHDVRVINTGNAFDIPLYRTQFLSIIL